MPMGYESPLKAMQGPREKLLYVPCIVPPEKDKKKERPDYLCTIDVDPSSPTYSQVIHRLKMTFIDDELHHTGYTIASSVATLTSLDGILVAVALDIPLKSVDT